MDVLKKLNELKKNNNWTNYRIAKEAGLSPATVKNVFERKTIPRVDTLEAICKAFGITLAQFFHEDERYVFLNDSQFELFELWECLPAYKKEALKYFLILMKKENDK